ncbi:YhcN/YlaJ family sporulation lipoprotein [Mesobacillus jeotgali]|uniref:YhcN/YlaJ family sporulation lipoprotein n=1 Tax=Mesobacillus jeotgali TaxID=129985 RepID=UPI0009A65026|nr:YhcN/YlaJ family sporulation lipoprotein [Mesobacillus jeotgali]
MIRIIIPLISLLVPAMLFTGCNTYTDEGADSPHVYGENNPHVLNLNEEYRSNSYNQTYRIKGNDDLEQQAEMLQNVQSATVITVQPKAYVAVVLEDGNTTSVPDEVYNKIDRQIKAADDAIKEVFVSSNADFVVEMTDFREQLQSRRPIPGLTEDFNTMIERVFPAHH